MNQNNDLNFLDKKNPPTETKTKKIYKTKKIIKKLLFFSIFVILLVVILKNSTIFGSDQEKSIFASIKDISKDIYNRLTIASDKEINLIGYEKDRINVLLLGIGGPGHDGGYLADTIMIASYQPSTNQAALISIPRDMVVLLPGYGWRRVNNINAFGEIYESGNGAEFMANELGRILDLDIPYYARIDFKGFSQLIDTLGGIDVYVENTLDDYQYPIPGRENAEKAASRYEHLHIDQGWQHMDGELALKYARSRHAIGVEHSDFARAKRQQNVIKALQDEVFSFKMLFTPGKINKIITTLKDHISTNFQPEEILQLIKIAKQVNQKEIINLVLDNQPGGPLVSKNYGGAAVLEPKDLTFQEINQLIASVFRSQEPQATLALENNSEANQKWLEESTQPTKNQEDSTNQPETEQNQNNSNNQAINSETTKPEKTPKQLRIEIYNGTWINGLAASHQKKLAQLDYQVNKIANAPTHDYSKTIIYQLNSELSTTDLNYFSNNYTSNILALKPDWLNTSADLVIVLGQDI